MKLRAIQLVFAISLMPIIVWGHGDDRRSASRVQKTESTVTAQPAVTVSLCVLSASVNVIGWDKNEVMVQSMEGALIQLRREAGADESVPARKIEVYVVDREDARRGEFRCQASSDLELRVPKGATVQIQSRDGSISITDVATAFAGSQNGDVTLERIAQGAEVGTIGGNISIKASTGRMDLNSAGGTVAAENVRPGDTADSFEASTVSGEIELSQVAHSLLNMRTITGNMLLSGPLASGGRYGINTMSGNVTLALPADASFQLNAKISSGGDIITDFPLTLLSQSVSISKPPSKVAPKPSKSTPSPKSAPGEPPNATPAPKPPAAPPATLPSSANPTDPVAPAPPPAPTITVKVHPTIQVDTVVRVSPIVINPHTLRRVSAICGSGDASISVASFSGTLHLQKN